MKITILTTKDGGVSVTGFPANFQQAQLIMHGAARAVAHHFVCKARAGELDADGTVVPKDRAHVPLDRRDS